MAISIKARDVPNFNSIGTLNGPKKDQYLDFVDDTGVTVASLLVPASGDTPTFSVDDAPVGGVQTVYSATVTLTDAQIKALPTTPIQILAAPGANKIICPQSFWFRLIWAADYMNISPDCSLELRSGGSQSLGLKVLENVVSGVTGLLAGGGPDGSNAFMVGQFQVSSIFAGVNGFAALSSLYDADIMNLPLNIASNNADGNFTGGNAGNSLIVKVNYSIIDFS